MICAITEANQEEGMCLTHAAEQFDLNYETLLRNTKGIKPKYELYDGVRSPDCNLKSRLGYIPLGQLLFA